MLGEEIVECNTLDAEWVMLLQRSTGEALEPMSIVDRARSGFLKNLEPLSRVIPERLFYGNAMSTSMGREHNLRFIALGMNDLKSSVLCLSAKTQARSIIEIIHNLDVVLSNLEITSQGSVDAEAVLLIVQDALGGNEWVTLISARDNAELQSLKVLVVTDTPDQHPAVKLSRDETFKVNAFEIERMVLLQSCARDASAKFLSLKVRLDDLEPLPRLILFRFLKRKRLSRTVRCKHHSLTIGLDMGDSQSPPFFLVQVQARGIIKFFNNLDSFLCDLEVSRDRLVDTEAVLHILIDTSGWDKLVASIIRRGNAELQLSKVLVLVIFDTTDDQVLVDSFRDETIKLEAFKIKGMVLLDGCLGNAPIFWGY
ncbi:MAG: hypothetical protein J3Q66DRAFT_336872 [Benniella sp.]|nr:MAG: hypothetical protein J3Q66DRAFT_336872 [Benniella sp.]